MPNTFIISWKGLMAKSWRPSKENKAALFIVSCLQLYHQGHIGNYTKKRLRDHSDERKAMPIFWNGLRKILEEHFYSHVTLFSREIQYRFSEKASKIWQNLPVNLSSINCQINWEILQKFCGHVSKPKLYQRLSFLI